MKQAWFLLPAVVLLVCGPALAEEGKRCTKTSVPCYDAKEKKARTCVTETCTFADGRTTTSVTVELQQGGKKTVRQVEVGQMVNIGNKSVMSVTPTTKKPTTSPGRAPAQPLTQQKVTRSSKTAPVQPLAAQKTTDSAKTKSTQSRTNGR